MTDWDLILRQYGRLVWQRVYRLLSNHADASDCFQDVFVSALEFSRRQTVQNWPGLLRRLATARALDRLRQRMRRSPLSTDLPDMSIVAGQEPTPLENAQSAELSQRFRQALAELPEQQAHAFCLRFFDSLSYQEIAEQMQMSPNAVGVLIHRARGRLEALLVVGDAREDTRAPAAGEDIRTPSARNAGGDTRAPTEVRR